MIQTIKQRIYLIGLLPLAALAMALVVLNGVYRIDEANATLSNAQRVTTALLQSPAADALIVGNVMNFEKIVADVLKASPWLDCVSLRNSLPQVISQRGRCDGFNGRGAYFPVTAPAGEFSDFTEYPQPNAKLGELGILMNGASVERKRQQVLIQLALSVAMICGVLGLVGRLLRVRLIEPLRRIGAALQALAERDYSARVLVAGNDEVTRLAEAINSTILTIGTYTRELERRRNDADRALHDADQANLIRDALVRSLSDDLNGPLNEMHIQLTAVAAANNDASLRSPIKRVIAMLQEAQNDFEDLMEVAATKRATEQPAARDVAEMLTDIERDIRVLSESEKVSVRFNVIAMPTTCTQDSQSGIFVDIDGVRLKKALVYLIRAMARHCKEHGIYINIELFKLSPDQLHFSVQLKAFYAHSFSTWGVGTWLGGLNQPGRHLPMIVGLTDREERIIEYLFRTIGIEPAASASPMGAVSIVLQATRSYTLEQGRIPVITELLFAKPPISAAVVSDDLSLVRLTTRGDIANLEVKLMPFSRAKENASALRHEDVVFIDISGDMADAMSVLEALKSEQVTMRNLIAICPSGNMSESLTERLLKLGFVCVVRKPLHYGRFLDVIGATVAHSSLNGVTDSH